MKVGAIVLAAGHSRRMGTQKLLLPLGNKPVIAHVIDTLLRCPIQGIHVVLGKDADRIRRVLEGRAVHFIPLKKVGTMLDSVRAGVRSLPRSCSAVLVALGDQPGIRSRLVRRMIATLENTPRGIIVPSCRGHHGHPLLFSTRFRREVLTRHDETGLRGLRYAHPHEVLEVKTAASSVLEDMDTPADYQRHLRRLVA